MRSILFGLITCLILSACNAATNGSNGPQSAANEDTASGQSLPPTSVSSQIGKLKLQTLTTALSHPWGMAFLPDGSVLISERAGRLRHYTAEGGLSAPLQGVPAVKAEGQGGLLDVALSPQFESDRLVYLSYAEPGDDDSSGTAVIRAKLDGQALTDAQVIFRQSPKIVSGHHYGSRLIFDRDGFLFISLGDRGQRPMAQELNNHMGTLIRLNADGSVPADNPFVGRDDALPEIWSYGHRNQQGGALNPWTGAVWTHEHGPRGGDEVNVPQAGKNYGWPIITHGINYSGLPIPEAEGKAKPGLESPHYVWEVSPAVSGMAFYAHDKVPAWQHSLFVGAMAQRALIRLSLEGDTVVAEERLLEKQGWRIRDVEVGPDGALYLLTDEEQGRLLKLEP
ncbi:PQQ-dependent sugar dehydrogenase [Pseudomarimonas arenosa]|uniref:PQQ-dependent sugar dehydrogenase n=1 Tax=Pseudomarimonas arenosa TaxID=2774145 RepID=A0AAW3ZMF3_9GAMM|nr:PQQ-dependent sugar dehydrogenase [Pseudomarimonas arenosa]MBD8527143.1 PQQ-dependent sugar dehydrogenase [Pseudomarimonas arenosa]